MLVWPDKAPTEVLDYAIDWSLRLNGDTISSSQWAIITTDGALTVQSNSYGSTATKVWVSGGSLKFNYVLQNTITTANGDTEVQSVMLPVRAK